MTFLRYLFPMSFPRPEPNWIAVAEILAPMRTAHTGQLIARADDATHDRAKKRARALLHVNARAPEPLHHSRRLHLTRSNPMVAGP